MMLRLSPQRPTTRRKVLTGISGTLLSGLAVCASPVFAAEDGFDDVAVIFVGASWCPHCKQAAPVLAAVLQPVGVPVLVASHDGRPILPFSQVEDARAHPVASEIVLLPTTLVYSRVTDGVVAQIEGYGGARRYATRVSAAVRQAAGLSAHDRAAATQRRLK